MDGWRVVASMRVLVVALIDTLGLARIRAKQRERVVLRAHRLSSELGQSKRYVGGVLNVSPFRLPQSPVPHMRGWGLTIMFGPVSPRYAGGASVGRQGR